MRACSTRVLFLIPTVRTASLFADVHDVPQAMKEAHTPIAHVVPREDIGQALVAPPQRQLLGNCFLHHQKVVVHL